ncbi:Gfo/Idh/MocA family protein [Autumnicola musiva]|uniref:Gfo/Idh/MocA family oxidoreductase n=1 Tax=Autumnicola musiva TaxID=3075589 RepID=A0ABU3D9N0_9FLAO|nr:Gfo/Idh/MocA family oxidoreductase [Zunongwangia sp. F117]MDT0677688.1 Gfo/Idh/MocA family oxidoreductase [Zunongwangia sp. F117]
MIKVAIVGVGKMGISHLSILGAHPDVEVVGVCDTSKMLLGGMEKYSSFACYTDYLKMVDETKPDAIFVAVPTKFHYPFIKELLQRRIHVFAEKPFCLGYEQGEELAQIASSMNLINQVGYHNKFIGTFKEVKRIIRQGHLGEIQHFVGEAYGPVVVKKKQDTWRSNPMEGGGCLMDYASHVIDLINDLIAPVSAAKGTIIKSFYSNKVDDAVYSLLELRNHVSGMISVNWSDETYRKMSTSVTIIGNKGKIISDANELKVYFKMDDCPEGYTKGWNVRYVTDLTEHVDFYLRGEEYSAQVDYFIKSIEGKVPNNINTFESASLTDKAISIIKENSKKISNGKNFVWG